MAAIILLMLMGGAFLYAFNQRLNRLERRLAELEGTVHRAPLPVRDVAVEEAPAPVTAPAATVEEPVLDDVTDSFPSIEPAAQPAPILPHEQQAIPDRMEEAPSAPRPSFGFEELFGRKLPIWAGGITLAIAGFLIVKYSIDLGLLSPLVRVVNGLLFGIVLIAAAEVALRKDIWFADPRVRQALAGAGIATLYGTILVAANLYHLVGPFPALLGMAAVTGVAMLLSVRFGAPSALLGLTGGLAAPALLGSGEPNIPLLSIYLALAVGGFCAVSRSQRWLWLGVSALVGGFGWGLLLILSGRLDVAASVAIGAYLLLLGVLLPLVSFGGQQRARLRSAASLMAAAQVAALVASGGFTILHWGMFALISIAMIWLARREEGLSVLPPLGVLISLLLLFAWPDPPIRDFAIAIAMILAIYGAHALTALWSSRGSMAEAGQLSALSLGGLLVTLGHFYVGTGDRDAAFALLSFGAALIPAVGAVLGVAAPGRRQDARFATLVSAAALLLGAAAYFALPFWLLPVAGAAIAASLLVLSRWADDARIEGSAWIALAVATLLLFDRFDEVRRAFGNGTAEHPLRAALRWGAPGAVAALLAWGSRHRRGEVLAQVAAVLLFQAAIAQVLPPMLLPLIAAASFAALAWWAGRLPALRLLPAQGALLAVVLAWGILPLGLWIGVGVEALAGSPMFVTELPKLEAAMMRLFLPALLIFAALWQRKDVHPGERAVSAASGGLLGGVAVHIFYKQLFAVDGWPQFVMNGVAERSLWEALLLVGAALLWRLATQRATLRAGAIALWLTGTAHLLWFSLVLHNPLWAQQEVGSLPLLNLVLLVYGLGLGALWLGRRNEPAFAGRHPHLSTVAEMLLILLGAFTLLRQAFHGALLVQPGVSDAEDICRSVLAIALGLAFLLWGIRSAVRDWRIGSLLLMLGAVAKVFLFDASGLEGLPRILSFVALGLSLIGIGWLYSRYLPDERRAGQPR